MEHKIVVHAVCNCLCRVLRRKLNESIAFTVSSLQPAIETYRDYHLTNLQNGFPAACCSK